MLICSSENQASVDLFRSILNHKARNIFCAFSLRISLCQSDRTSLIVIECDDGRFTSVFISIPVSSEVHILVRPGALDLCANIASSWICYGERLVCTQPLCFPKCFLEI